MMVRCKCGDYHTVPESLKEAPLDWDAWVTVAVLGRGSWRIPKSFLYFHAFQFENIPELAGQFGFECVGPG